MTASARLSHDDARACAAATQAGIDRRRRIREYVAAHPGATQADVMAALGLSRSQATMCWVRGIERRRDGHGPDRYYPEEASP